MTTEDAQQDGIASRVKRPLWILAILVALLAAVTLLPVLAQEATQAPTADPSPSSVGTTASDPDFSTVDDPLNGEYELYAVDDLVISRPKPINNQAATQEWNYILETANTSIVSQDRLLAGAPGCFVTTSGNRQPQMTRIGRFFELPYDVIVTLGPSEYATGSNCQAPNGKPGMQLTITVPPETNYRFDFDLTGFNTAVTMDDFNYDGYEDLLIMSNAGILVATANDVNDFSKGFEFGPVTPMPQSGLAAESDPVTGDFNGDGLLDMAWIGNSTVHYATVCPEDDAPSIHGLCDGKQALEVLIDPLNSQEYPHGPATGQCPHTVMALAAGNFSGALSDDLVLLDCQNGKEIHARWFKFDDKMTVTGGSQPGYAFASKVIISGFTSASDLYAQAAKLDLFKATEQVALATGTFNCPTANCANYGYHYDENVHVITFQDNGMTDTGLTGYTKSCNYPNGPICSTPSANAGSPTPWVNGLAVGYFSAVDLDSSTAPAALQLATVLNEGYVRIYKVDPDKSFELTLASETALDSTLQINYKGSGDPNRLNWLTAGDYQGRSIRLGPPSIVRLASHSQPSVILGAPPMHVDYILPDSATSSDWGIVNFSAVSSAFNSSFTMSQTTSNQSADTNTTSYTFATTVKENGKVSLKPPLFSDVGVSLEKSGESKSESVKETYTYTQNEFQYNASATTGFGDEIWYDESAYNLYMYPVIGRTVCPSDVPNCTPAQEQPLYLTFSGPDSIGTGPAPGATTEWYQPVHEPGNIFSYPWNEAMLAQQLSGRLDLLSTPQHFYTDDSPQAQNANWSTNTGSDVTTGTTNTHSSETAFSQTAGLAIGKVVEASSEFSVNISASTAISTLNKSTSSLGASQGIQIQKPAAFLAPPLYQYRVDPYIFGRLAPVGSVDNPQLTEDIKSFGPLQVAYTTDPLDSKAGSWWNSDSSPYTQYIDVALNHPVRWSNNPDGGGTLDCITVDFVANCKVFNDPNPANLWNSEFYWMRGLYVTVDGTGGPQRTQAVAGEEVFLQARVYNYSLKDMPAGSKIQVRFYRQPISGTTPAGNSVLISQVTADPLPAFNSQTQPNQPNYTLVTTSLDTSNLGGTYQIFWVVVWVEDGSGNMITELPGHGLSAKPGSLATIGDVLLEEVTLDGATKTFSNNVGYLHSKFYIAPAGLGAPPPGDLVLGIQNAQVTPPVSLPGGRVIVSADISAEGAPANGVHVQIFPDAFAWQANQDDPSAPAPRPFDVEMLPYIGAGLSDRVEVPYTPLACGVQTILIVAYAGGESATGKVTLDNGPCRLYFPVVPVQSQK